MHFQESLLPFLLGIIWQASCWILAVFCVGERKSTSEFTRFGRKWIGICTTWSTKWTHKGIWMLYQSASPSQTSKGMSPGTRGKKTTSSANQHETSWPMTKKTQKTSMVRAANIQAQRLDQGCVGYERCREAISKESLSVLRYLMRLNSQFKQILRSWKWHWSKTW